MKGNDKVVETVSEKKVKGLANLHENSKGMTNRGRVAPEKADKMLHDNAFKSLFKSLGITVGEPTLLETKECGEIQKGEDWDTARPGIDGCFRDRLEKSLGMGSTAHPSAKAGEKEVKNTSGEQFHTDNCKLTEKFVTDVSEVEPHLDAELEPKDPKRVSHNPMVTELFFCRSEAKVQEDIFGAAFGDEKPAQKKAKPEPKAVKKSEIDELYDLVKANAGEGSRGGQVIGHTPSGKPIYGTHAEHKPKGKTHADYLRNLGVLKPKAPAKPAETASTGPKAKYDGHRIPYHTVKSFVKAAGPGGVLFDFGSKTGNPMADRATEILAAHTDPIQGETAKSQRVAYENAIKDWVKKGESEFVKAQDGDTSQGVNSKWNDQLNKPMDQQVKEAFQKGQLDEITAGAPAPVDRSQFAKSQIRVGNEVVAATSETDAALVDMMNKSGGLGYDDSGVIVDAGAGGRRSVMIDTLSGQVLDSSGQVIKADEPVAQPAQTNTGVTLGAESL